MALVNDPRIYGGSAVVFDASQPINLYTQLAARKQAKDEAVSQYFNDLPNKINMAGVRMQDLESQHGGINQEIEKWKNNWLTNKDVIKKGGLAQQEHMSQFQQILRKIDQSKQRAKLSLDLGKAKFEGKYDPDEDDLKVLDRIDRSIYDPESYKQDGVSEFGWGDLSPNIPDFDEKKFIESVRGIAKPSKKYGTPGEYDPKTGQRAVPFELKYTPEQLKVFAETGRRVATTDKSARKFANKILSNPDSPEFKELEATYNAIYPARQRVQPDGRIVIEQNLMDTPEEVMAAITVLRNQGSFGGGEELKADPIEADKRKRALAAYNSALIASRGGGSGKNEGVQWDLTEYPTVGESKDLTVPFQGYKVTAIGKETLLAKKVLYNPKTKKFTVTEYVGRDEKGDPTGEKTTEISAKTMRQNIQGMNPGTDMKPFDALVGKDPIEGERKQTTTKPKKDPLGIFN